MVLDIGSWDERKDRLKEKFPVLTDTDLVLDGYNRNEMFTNLKTKLNKSDSELHAIIMALSGQPVINIDNCAQQRKIKY